MNTQAGSGDLYAFDLCVTIAAAPSRVWRALCDPAEVIRWDNAVEAAMDAPPDYPRPGQHVRWRYRGSPFGLLHDRPQEVQPNGKLRSLLALGPFRYDETYTLQTAPEGCRLTASLAVRTALPLIGPLVDRFYLGPSTRRAFEASLASIKGHCEPA